MTLEELVRHALAEDVGPGDFTTLWTVPDHATSTAIIVAKEPLVVAGLAAVREVFAQVDPGVDIRERISEGQQADTEEVIAELEGPTRAILTGERVALNFLGRLSGIATLTQRFQREAEETRARVIDTRKTTPGWRQLEKAAVRAGGGANHRMGLHDMVLIKDNHAAAAGGVGAAVRRVNERNDRGLEVEAEVSDLDELRDAIEAGAHRILLDNMNNERLAEAVRVARDLSPDVSLEASGNMTLDRIRGVAATGVDFISVGALTHSAPYADVSLRIRG